MQVNADGVFRYAYIPWFAQALQVLALSGVHGVAVDVWVSEHERCSTVWVYISNRVKVCMGVQPVAVQGRGWLGPSQPVPSWQHSQIHLPGLQEAGRI
jgi:hypothetical protein